MTICIAASCDLASCLVLAADTMVTNHALSIEFEHPGKKITPLSENCVAMTAGDALAYTELFNAVKGEICQFRQPSVLDIVGTIKQSYQAIRRQEIIERVLQPRGFENFDAFYQVQRHLSPEIIFPVQAQIDNYEYGLDIIVAGVTGNYAHIYGVSNPGTSRCFDAINFHAIGSGLPHAVNSLIARGINSGTSLAEAILTVYEAKTAAEKAPGVGNVTDMIVMSEEGILEISREKISLLKPIHQL